MPLVGLKKPTQSWQTAPGLLPTSHVSKLLCCQLRLGFLI